MRVENLLARSAAADPAKTAIVADGARLSYGDLDATSEALARSLVARGVRRGDRVIVLMDNVREAAVAIFGVLKAGAVFCPVNPAQKADGLRFVIESCRPAVILTQARHVAMCGAALAGLAEIPAIIATGAATQPAGIIESFDACLAVSGGPLPSSGSDEDLAMLIYTSGSTGRPKGAMMSHAGMDFASAAIASYLENTVGDVVLSALPVSFTYGLYQLLVAVRVGATLVLEKNFAFPAAVLETARAERVTGLPLVPTMASVLLAMKDLRPGALPALRYVTSAAAPLPPAHVEGLQRLFPGMRLYSMYGMTECARAAYLPPEEIERRPGSVGKAVPGTAVAIVDETGRPLPAGETGELLVHGPHLMRGYWQDEAATRLALRENPRLGGTWLHTGDLFSADADGFLTFVGRRDDMLKVRGEKVAPKQVEAVLHDCPGIAEAVVIGRPDPVAGHLLHAVVVRNAPALTEREVMRHCAARLPDVMVPRSVEFRAELPRTASGKVARRLVA